MSSHSKHYLCRDVQEGEIDQKDLTESSERIAILNRSKDLVQYGIRAGLLRMPSVESIEQAKRKREAIIDTYPCVRAYQLRNSGMPMLDVAKAITCSSERIKEVVERGRVLMEAQGTNSIGLGKAIAIGLGKPIEMEALEDTKQEKRQKSSGKAPHSGKRVASHFSERERPDKLETLLPNGKSLRVKRVS
jgi:hypothetical protein